MSERYIVSDKDASITMQHSQDMALRQIELELQYEAWKLPGKAAERLDAFEARLATLIARHYGQAMAPFSSEASPQPQPQQEVQLAKTQSKPRKSRAKNVNEELEQAAAAQEPEGDAHKQMDLNDEFDSADELISEEVDAANGDDDPPY